MSSIELGMHFLFFLLKYECLHSQLNPCKNLYSSGRQDCWCQRCKHFFFSLFKNFSAKAKLICWHLKCFPCENFLRKTQELFMLRENAWKTELHHSQCDKLYENNTLAWPVCLCHFLFYAVLRDHRRFSREFQVLPWQEWTKWKHCIPGNLPARRTRENGGPT